MRVPALKLLLPLILGIFLTRYLFVSLSYLIAASVALTLGLMLFYKLQRDRLFAASSAFLFVVIGLTVTEIKSIRPRNHIVHFCDLPSRVSLEGVVVSPADVRISNVKYTVKVDTVWAGFQPFAVTGKSQVTLYFPHVALEYGDRIILRGRLERPPKSRNPGEFDYQSYLAAQGIDAVCRVYDSVNIRLLNRGEGSYVAREIVYPAREFIIRFINAALPPGPGSILEGLLVGARGEIDPELRERFADVGVVHVLAVSGLHVGFVLLGLIFVLQLCQVPQPVRAVIILGGLFFYAFLTGFHAPVVRASVMASILLIGHLLKRTTHPLNSIAIAGIIILVANPLDLFQAGFQLSFSAVIGIILIYERLYNLIKTSFLSWQESGNRFQSNALILFFVSLAAQLGTLPVTAYYFGRIPILSLIANSVVVPLVGLIVGLGFVSLFGVPIFFPIGVALASVNGILINVLTTFVTWSGNLPFSHIKVARPDMMLFFIYFGALAMFVYWKQRRVRIAGSLILVTLILIALLLPFRNKNQLEVIFFDVGQGDAALVTFPNGKNLLIDAGERTDRIDMGKQVLLPYFRRFGIRRLDHLLITHNHSDHAGGAISLLQGMKIGRLLKSTYKDSSYFEITIDSLARARGVPVQPVARGDTVLVDRSALILVLHPPAGMVESEMDLNNQSVVIKIVYGRTSFLFTGDAEEPAEKMMLDIGPLLKADVLKVGHHGSLTSSSGQFRELVRPDIAVVSVKKYNRFGLPSQQLLEQFKKEGALVLRTDNSGAIRLRSDGKEIKNIGTQKKFFVLL